MAGLPSGTVTFLFTDVEGSTRLLHELGDGYAEVLAEHRRVLRDAFARQGGVEVDTQGDALRCVCEGERCSCCGWRRSRRPRGGADSSAHGLALRELSRKSSSASETSDTRRAGVAWALLAAATALLARGIDEPAAKLLGAAEQILDETGAYIGPTERRLHEPLPAFIRDHGLDDARLSGYAMTLEEAVDLAVRSLD